LRELILHARNSAACFENSEISYNKWCSDKKKIEVYRQGNDVKTASTIYTMYRQIRNPSTHAFTQLHWHQRLELWLCPVLKMTASLGDACLYCLPYIWLTERKIDSAIF
jgi:hypothetical protein